MLSDKTSSNWILALLQIGVIGGTLDISDALIFSAFRGIGPVKVFQYIASGLIDGRSFGLGMKSVLLGVTLHYTIAFTWTTVYYAANRRITFLRRHIVISGLLYGVVVYGIMNFVVLPLSAVSPRPSSIASRVNAVLALMICIGLPIAFLMSRDRRLSTN